VNAVSSAVATINAAVMISSNEADTTPLSPRFIRSPIPPVHPVLLVHPFRMGHANTVKLLRLLLRLLQTGLQVIPRLFTTLPPGSHYRGSSRYAGGCARQDGSQ
jgi:hypothetical protein